MAAMVNMNSLLNGKDSRWLQLEVCREFQRNKCSRQDTECKFAHPPANVEVQNGKVTACYDSIKGRCNRDKPPCKYFHPPQHLKDQLLINGRNHLALKNALMQQMGIAPGQPVIPGQVPTVSLPDVQHRWTYVDSPNCDWLTYPQSCPVFAAGALQYKNNMQQLSAQSYDVCSQDRCHTAQDRWKRLNPMNEYYKQATNPYLTGIPANTYSPYFAPGHLVPTILGPDPSAVASQLGPVVPQAVPVAQQKIPRSDRLEVCREFMRGACKRAESECRFAHPQESVTTHEDGSVTVCMDAVKGRCARDPCRYFHPPLHLQAQIKAAQSRATATAPVSTATLTHPIPTPGAAPPPNAVAIGHPLEVGKKRAAENDMFQLMDVKTVGSFYYENFAFSGMVPYKRPAAEKSGIPVYQPGTTTYQQLMQLQQPFVPVSSSSKVPLNASYVIYTDANGQLLDTLPVCQDFNRSMCSRLNCRFVHLTEDDKVEVCDQRVAVCRDHANGQCRRKLCKYYHIPVVLPPANIMATIFNQQPPQQSLQHHQQLATTSTITSIEQQQKQQEQLQQQQQLSITKNTTRATSATYTSLSNHNNNNNLVNSLNNNILYNNNNENNNNTLTSQQQHCIISPPLPPQILSTSNLTTAATQITSPAAASSATFINASATSNPTALTTSTTTMPTPMATATTNLSAVAIAAAYNPTFQHLLKAQPFLASNLAYYDLTNSNIGDFNTNCIPLLSANPTYAAEPILYPSAVAQHQNHRQQHPQLTAIGRGTSGIIKNIHLGSAIGQQHAASNVANLPTIATTST